MTPAGRNGAIVQLVAALAMDAPSKTKTKSKVEMYSLASPCLHFCSKVEQFGMQGAQWHYAGGRVTHFIFAPPQAQSKPALALPNSWKMFWMCKIIHNTCNESFIAHILLAGIRGIIQNSWLHVLGRRRSCVYPSISSFPVTIWGFLILDCEYREALQDYFAVWTVLWTFLLTSTIYFLKKSIHVPCIPLASNLLNHNHETKVCTSFGIESRTGVAHLTQFHPLPRHPP